MLLSCMLYYKVMQCTLMLFFVCRSMIVVSSNDIVCCRMTVVDSTDVLHDYSVF